MEDGQLIRVLRNLDEDPPIVRVEWGEIERQRTNNVRMRAKKKIISDLEFFKALKINQL